MKYTIKKNVPIKPKKRNAFKEIIAKLDVGDSVTIEDVGYNDNQIIRNAAWDLGVRVSLSMGSGGEKGAITVWRIE